MSGGQICKDQMDLARVAMPLVRLMRDGSLSWAHKEEIAGVIRDLCRERSDWWKEQQTRSISDQLQRAQAQGAAIQAAAGWVPK